jgi:hypothetical protein
MSITPAQRFAAHDAKASAPLGGPEYRALNAASYWESFPASYTAEQVAAAQALLVSIHADGLTGSQAQVAAVLALVTR